MNIDRENRFPQGFPPGSQPDPNYPTQPQRLRRELTPDEVKIWKDCSREAFWYTALPFAVGMQIYYLYKKKPGNMVPENSVQAAPNPSNGVRRIPILRSASLFIFNLVLGNFFYTPVCYGRLKNAILENEKKFAALAAEGGRTFVGTEESSLRPDDNFQSNLDLNLDGPQSNFSHLAVDFDPSISERLVLEDDIDEKAKQPSIPQTTYDNLRRLNRERYNKSVPQPSPVQGGTSTYSSPLQEKPSPESPPRKVTRNKYGDEME